MKKLSLPLALVFIVSTLSATTVVNAASNFVVNAGETVVIAPGTRLDGFYNSLVLEDNAQLIINVSNVVFKVGEIKIGNGVRIIGNGRDGVDGTSANSNKPTTGLGDGGWPGDDGSPGSDGKPGADLTIIAGKLYPIGSNFRVELKGGDGGNGGNGGGGGQGGPAECHQVAGDGGPGGNGAHGGNGGRGGKFLLQFAGYSGQTNFFIMDPDTFLVDGGQAGLGGALGGGGHGGDGVNCPFFLGGARGGGGVGGNGRRGTNGRSGARSSPEIRPI